MPASAAKVAVQSRERAARRKVAEGRWGCAAYVFDEQAEHRERGKHPEKRNETRGQAEVEQDRAEAARRLEEDAEKAEDSRTGV